MLEIKNMETEMKDTFNGCTSRFYMDEGRISELEDI